MIFVWFDAEGRDPMYQLTEFDEIKKKHWTYRLDQYTSTMIWNCTQGYYKMNISHPLYFFPTTTTCTQTLTNTCNNKHIHIHMHMHTHTHTHMHARTHTCTHTHMHAHPHARTHTHIIYTHAQRSHRALHYHAPSGDL